MATLSLSEAKVLLRRNTVRKLFSPLCRTNHVLVFVRAGKEAVQVGLGADNFGSSLRHARFPSRVTGVSINYFENWVIAGSELRLEKAYLHLDEPTEEGVTDREILALHCDPLTPKSDGDYFYKRGPHVHLPAKFGGNFHKSHVALCLPSLDKTCTEYAEFNRSLKLLIGMVNDEFLGRYA